MNINEVAYFHNQKMKMQSHCEHHMKLLLRIFQLPLSNVGSRTWNYSTTESQRKHILFLKTRNNVYRVGTKQYQINKSKITRMFLLFQNGNGPVFIVDEGNAARPADPALLGVVDSEHDRHRHVDDWAVPESERVKMKSLEELGFPLEPFQGASPAFAEHMHPLKIDLRQLDLGQTRSQFSHRLPVSLLHEELNQAAAVGLDQPARNPDPGSGPAGYPGRESER